LQSDADDEDSNANTTTKSNANTSRSSSSSTFELPPIYGHSNGTLRHLYKKKPSKPSASPRHHHQQPQSVFDRMSEPMQKILKYGEMKRQMNNKIELTHSKLTTKHRHILRYDYPQLLRDMDNLGSGATEFLQQQHQIAKNMMNATMDSNKQNQHHYHYHNLPHHSPFDNEIQNTHTQHHKSHSSNDSNSIISPSTALTAADLQTATTFLSPEAEAEVHQQMVEEQMARTSAVEGKMTPIAIPDSKWKTDDYIKWCADDDFTRAVGQSYNDKNHKIGLRLPKIMEYELIRHKFQSEYVKQGAGNKINEKQFRHHFKSIYS